MLIAKGMLVDIQKTTHTSNMRISNIRDSVHVIAAKGGIHITTEQQAHTGVGANV